MDTAGLRDLGEHVAASLSDYVHAAEVQRDELVIDARADQVARVLKFLKDDSRCRFEQLIDLCGVDYPERDPRFDVVYHLLSMSHNRRLRLRIGVNDDQPVPSAVAVYPSAGWWEREAWDLYGIHFAGNPDLRRPAHRLRLRRPSAAQGLSAHRLCRAALRQRAEAGGV